MRYTVVLEEEPDGGYVVSVPALPGCVSQGDTGADGSSPTPASASISWCEILSLEFGLLRMWSG